MKRIYVSYRRTDTSESYGRLVSRLADYFGAEAVLRTDVSYAMRHDDTESISPQDYRVFVAEQLRQCAVLLLVIGPHWLASPTSDAWDIHTPDDPARIEIEEALRAGIPVVPTLVQQAEMPKAGDLPPSVGLMLRQDSRQSSAHSKAGLLALVGASGMVVRRDPDFNGDTQRLCEVIENLAGLDAAKPEQAAGLTGRTLRMAILLGGGALLAHAVILAYLSNEFALPQIPRLAIPALWLSQVVVTGLIDWGIFFLLGYFIGRRTKDSSLGGVASVAVFLIGLVGGVIIFADLAWANQVSLGPTGSEAVPALIVGAPIWIELPVMLLMRPFILTFAVIVLGAPLGLAASVGLGMLGGNWGADMADRQLERVARRERRFLLQAEAETDSARSGSRHAARATLFGRRSERTPRYHEAALVGKLFISYRRDDSAVMCGAIYDRLSQAFGAQAVFKDVDMIPVGVNFERFINSSLEECVAQVVVIGPRWVDISTSDGQRRLDDPRDFVRLEVESALRSGLVVVPVLTQSAKLPGADELPESLRPLAELTPVEVGYAPKFDADIRRLTTRLAPTMFSNEKTPLLKRLTSVRVGLAESTVAATWWLALLTTLGVTLGLAAYHIFLLDYRTAPTLIINYLASAPVIVTAFVLIGGAHLATTTRRMGRALWLIMRAALAGVEAFALTSQIDGLVAHRADLFGVVQNDRFRLVALGAPLAGLAMLIGPLLFAALLSTAVGAFVSNRIRASGAHRRAPQRVTIVYQPEDAAVATRVSRSLTSWFGQRIVAPVWPRALERGGRWLVELPVWARLRRVVDETRWLRPVAFAFPRRAPLTQAEQVARSLRGTAAVLALVGPGWTAPTASEAGLSDPLNPVRVSIETALGLNIPIVPTLLTGATMPAVDALPASVREFAMLNGASVRNPPDFEGDIHRLIRVIERLTNLRQARRLIDTIAPVMAGSLLSALALAGVDFLAAALVARGLAQTAAQSQASQALIAGSVGLVDLIIYGLTAALVMRASNRRLLSVLTALLGAVLGATAGVFALRYQAANTRALVAQQAGSSHVYDQFLDVALLFLIFRLFAALVGSVVVGFLGALVGKLAYQNKERRQQERRLLALVRQSARNEPLAELSARGVGVRKTQPIAPVAEEAAPSLSAPDVAAAAGDANGALEGGGQDEQASQLLRDMRLAKRRVRLRARLRLGGLASGVLVIALIALVTGSALFLRQSSETAAQSTAAAVAAATETAVTLTIPEAYLDTMPGGDCPGAQGEGSWSPEPKQSVTMTCDTTVGATSTIATVSNSKPLVLRLTLTHLIANSYLMSVDTSFTDLFTCTGLVFFGGTQSASRMLFELCDDGKWRVMSQATSGSLHVFTQGLVKLSSDNLLAISVAPGQVIFQVNGADVMLLKLRHPPSAPNDYEGIYMRSYVNKASTTISAEFYNFAYRPA